MMEEIQQFNIERESLANMVAMVAMGDMVISKFTEIGIEAPEWLGPKVRSIRRQIRITVQDRKEKRVAELRLALDADKSPQEKKAARMAELRRLEKELAEV